MCPVWQMFCGKCPVAEAYLILITAVALPLLLLLLLLLLLPIYPPIHPRPSFLPRAPHPPLSPFPPFPSLPSLNRLPHILRPTGTPLTSVSPRIACLKCASALFAPTPGPATLRAHDDRRDARRAAGPRPEPLVAPGTPVCCTPVGFMRPPVYALTRRPRDSIPPPISCPPGCNCGAACRCAAACISGESCAACIERGRGRGGGAWYCVSE